VVATFDLLAEEVILPTEQVKPAMWAMSQKIQGAISFLGFDDPLWPAISNGSNDGSR
jgi:hypothetical protein